MRQFSLLYVPVLIFLIACQHIEPLQELERKALLGIMMEEISDDNRTIVQINSIMPTSSAANLGVVVGDKLLELNGNSISTMSDVQTAIATIRANDSLQMVVLRGASLLTLEGSAVGRPKEVSEFGEVIYSHFEAPGHKIRTIFHLPDSIENPPVVFFLQGYICQSTEFGNLPNNPAKKLIDSWVKAGFAVFRMEKAGQGDSISEIPCMEMDYQQEYALFEKGYEHLLVSEQVNTDKIFLFGHSMGAVIAPMLAQFKSPAGVLTYGASGKNWADYMEDIMTQQPTHFGRTEAEIEESSGPGLAFVQAYLRDQLSSEAILKNEETRQYLVDNNFEEAFTQGTYLMRSHSFWQSLAKIDMTANWSSIKSPVLCLHGSLDIQAIDESQAKVIVNSVNQGAAKADFKLIEGADHGFVRFETMRQNVEFLGNGQYRNYAETNFHEGIGVESIKWMNAINRLFK